MKNKKILEIANELAEVEVQLKDLQARKDNLKKLLLNGGVDNTIKGENFIVKYSPTTSVSRFDTKSFKADHERLYKKYIIETTRNANFSITLK